MLQKLVGILLILVTQFLLQSSADGVNVGIQQLDDMEHVNADGNVWKAALGQSDESAMHVTGKVFHFLALGKIKREEVWHELFQCDLRENVDDTAGITIGDIAVKFVCNPALSGGIIDAGGTLEFRLS